MTMPCLEHRRQGIVAVGTHGFRRRGRPRIPTGCPSPLRAGTVVGRREACSYPRLRTGADGRFKNGSPNESAYRQTSVAPCFRLLTTIFLISAGHLPLQLFPRAQPWHRHRPHRPVKQFELSPVTLVVFSMAVGAVLVALAVGMRQTAHVIGNWRSTRLQRRKEKIDALHREGTHAFMSKRTIDAVGLFEKALSIDPNQSRLAALVGQYLSFGK